MQTISELERTLQFVKKKDKVETLIQLAKLYLETDLQAASIHARNAKKLARKLKLDQAEAAASRIVAEILFLTSKYRNAIELLGESLSLTRNSDDQEGLGATLLDLGKNHFKLSEYDKSVEFYFGALALAKEQKDNFQQAEILNNLALTSIVTGDYAQAKDHLLKVIKVWKNRDYDTGIFNALLNLGIIALRQDRIDEARSQTNKALELAEKIGKENFIAAAANSLGILLIKEDKYEKALDLLLEYADLLEENDQAVWVYADILNNVSTCYLRLSDLEQAKEYANKSLKIAREIESRLLIVKNLEVITQLALEQEEYKLAYESSNELYELKQLIYDREVAAKIAAVRLRSGESMKSSGSDRSGQKRLLSENVLEQRIKEIIQDNEQFQLIIESSEDVITLHDSKGKYLYCNRSFLYNIKSEDLIGKSPYNFYKFEYGDALVRQIKYTYSSGKSNHMDSLMEVDGQDRWFNNYIFPVSDIDGNILAVAMLSRLASTKADKIEPVAPNLDEELVKQLEDLKHKQLIWQSFQEDVRKFVTFRVELNDEAPVKQKVVFFSSSLKDMLGINLVDDFAKWFQNIHADEKEKLVNAFRNTVEDGKFLKEEIKILHPELNEYRWVELMLDPVVNNGKVDFLNGIITDITSRKQETESLQKKLASTLLNKELLQISLQSFVLTELDGTIVDFNRAFPALIGYNLKTVAGLNWKKDLTSAEFLPEEERILHNLSVEGKHQIYEKVIPGKDKLNIETEISVHAILNDIGKIHRYCYFITDISSRNKLISQMRSSNLELTELLSSIPEVLLQIDKKGLIRKVIPTPLAEKLGLKQNLEGKGLDQIFPDEILTGLRSIIKKCLNTKEPARFDFQQNDLMLQAEVAIHKDNLLILMIRDISSLKEAETDLEKSRQKYLRIFHTAPQPLCLLNEDMKIAAVNAAFAALTGFSQEELQDKNLKELISGQEEINLISEHYSNPEATALLELEISRKDKSLLPVSLKFSLFEDQQKQLLISWQDLSMQLTQLDALAAQFREKELDYQDKIKAVQNEISSNQKDHQAELDNVNQEFKVKEEKHQAEIDNLNQQFKAKDDEHQNEIDNLNQQFKAKDDEHQAEIDQSQSAI